MVMHKVDARMEAGKKPERSIVEKMGAFVGKSIEEGVFKDGAGLHPSAQRARVAVVGGKRTVVKGPYEGGNELLASFAMIQAGSMDEAVEVASRMAAEIGRDCELEVGLVVEPWEIGISKRPENPQRRWLLLRKADEAFERGETAVAGGAEIEKLRKAGALVAEGALKASSKGARLEKGTRRWTDGPFAESKELVAGYSVIEVPTLEAAKRWAEAYGEILLDNEVDVREVAV